MSKETDSWPVIVEETYDSSIERVWRALTVHEEMIRWFFENMPDFKPEKGFQTSFIVQSETRTFPHQWEVLEVIPEKKISINWNYDGYTGNAVVHFELKPGETGCTLRVTNEITEPLQEGIPEFEPGSCRGGWEFFLKDRLKKYLSS